MKPAIVFNISDLQRNFVGETFEDIYHQARDLHKALKQATGYTWDNQHWFIENMYGEVSLSLSLHNSSASLYDTSGAKFVDTLCGGGIFTEAHLEQIKEALYEMANGRTKCNSCKKWANDYKKYSFAGSVCNDCYDPNKHKGPDTRGD